MFENLVFLFCHDQTGCFVEIIARGIHLNLGPSCAAHQGNRKQDETEFCHDFQIPWDSFPDTLPSAKKSSPKLMFVYLGHKNGAVDLKMSIQD